MAQEEKKSDDAPAPKSKKMLIIIIAVVVLVLAIGGGAAFMLMGGKGKKHGKPKEAEEQVEEAEPEEGGEHGKPAPVVALEEKFLVNLRSDDGSSHFMQIPKIELEVANEVAAKKVEEKKSKISDRINTVLRAKTMKEMLEPGSDVKLKEELRDVINEALEVKPEAAAKKGVKEVIMPASFIVQ